MVPPKFSETVGEIFFSASLSPKLRSRAKVRGGDETSSSAIRRTKTINAINANTAFSATLNTPGTQSLTATNKYYSSITGTQTGILVPCTPPVINCPTVLPVPATSPNGASVTFSVTAAGSCSVGTICVIAGTSTTVTSPYTFPIGTTTVNCTSTNSANQQDSCSFTVRVKGDTAQITDLIANVNSLNIPSALKTALTVKLNAALADLSVNDTADACGNLAAFINLAQAQAGKKIMPSSTAKDLTSVALRIQAVMGRS
jgi:hypothetical protein